MKNQANTIFYPSRNVHSHSQSLLYSQDVSCSFSESTYHSPNRFRDQTFIDLAICIPAKSPHENPLNCTIMTNLITCTFPIPHDVFSTEQCERASFKFWWFYKLRTFLMSAGVVRFFILYKRKACETFPHRRVLNTSCGIGNMYVMRSAIIVQSSSASCERFAGMQMAKWMKVWSRKRFAGGMRIRKMNKTHVVNAIVIVNGNEIL